MKSRGLSGAKVGRCFRMWKTNPDATIEDLDGKSGPGPRSLLFRQCWRGMEDDPQPVMLRYEAKSYKTLKKSQDAYQYQHVFAPLVKMEADYDKKVKESQSQENAP